jgi:hypothetical protein
VLTREVLTRDAKEGSVYSSQLSVTGVPINTSASKTAAIGIQRILRGAGRDEDSSGGIYISSVLVEAMPLCGFVLRLFNNARKGPVNAFVAFLVLFSIFV